MNYRSKKNKIMELNILYRFSVYIEYVTNGYVEFEFNQSLQSFLSTYICITNNLFR